MTNERICDILTLYDMKRRSYPLLTLSALSLWVMKFFKFSERIFFEGADFVSSFLYLQIYNVRGAYLSALRNYQSMRKSTKRKSEL